MNKCTIDIEIYTSLEKTMFFFRFLQLELFKIFLKM